MEKRIQLPITRETARTIKAGEACLLSGVIYTARDAAHKRLVELVNKGEPLPFDIKDATIYYVGPTPESPAMKNRRERVHPHKEDRVFCRENE